jgi:acyl-CoA thioesterase FadM
MIKAQCVFKSPIYALDEIEIESEVVELKRKSFKMNHIVTNKTSSKLVAEGYTIGVFVDRDRKSVGIPKWFSDKVIA